MVEVEITRHSIRTWIETVATGEFHYANVLGLRGKLEPSEDAKLRKIIFELSHASHPICESVGRNDGYYRPIQNGLPPIDFSLTEEKTSFPVVYPFNLREWVFIYPNTVTVVAGSKSSGKTGFLYRSAGLNRTKVHTVILSNMEGGKEQMYDRFLPMGIDLKKDVLGKNVFHVSENFHDYITEPNTLYIIDYIDCPDGESFYLIGAAITKVRKKLDNSHAIIGLQKPMGRDTAFGGDQTLKDAALYIAMDNKKLKIVDAKVPTDKQVHPKNMQWTFTYDQEGTKFNNIQPFYGES